MDREKSLTLLWPEWGSYRIPSDPQSDSNRLRHRPGLEKNKKNKNKKNKNKNKNKKEREGTGLQGG
jgi:hypothetical protein